jgi:small subunit ribosomal protein S4
VSFPLGKNKAHTVFGKPHTLLFSIDQFLFESMKTSPQRKKVSEFQKQLKERKKLALFYGCLSKKQLLSFFQQAPLGKGFFSKNLLSLLEKRLETTLYRTGLAQTPAMARQLITHKHILRNNTVVSNPNCVLQSADIISLKTGWKKRVEKALGQTLHVSQKKWPLLPESSLQRDVVSRYEILDSKKLPGMDVISKNKISQFSTFLLSLSKTRTYYKTSTPGSEKQKTHVLYKYKASPLLRAQSNVTRPHGDSPQNTPKVSGDLVFTKKNSLLFSRKDKFLFSRKEKDLSRRGSPLFFRKGMLFLLNTLSSSHFLANRLRLKFQAYFSIHKNPSAQGMDLKGDLLQLLGKKPLHLEISYRNGMYIYLYAPQRIFFPFFLNLELIKRGFR